MYFRFKGTKYFVDVPAKAYQENPQDIYISDVEEPYFVKITSWLGKRPQKVEELLGRVDATKPILMARPCLYTMPGYPITPPITWNSLIIKIHKEKAVNFTTYASLTKDILAHTDLGLKQELVTKVLIEEQHWGKVEVSKYKIIGVEVPDQLIVNFDVVMRRRF